MAAKQAFNIPYIGIDHYFGTDLFPEEPGLPDGDKRALIEFLKIL